MKHLNITIAFTLLLVAVVGLKAQQKSLVNTSDSPFAKMYPVDLEDATWTTGFWADWFKVCEESMVPHMMKMYMDDSISHGFANFEIAAGIKKGEHIGPPFHDGDFYKMLEALIVVNSVKKDAKIEHAVDSIINIIGMCQRTDGYIHTPVVIAEKTKVAGKDEFGERLDFETYNFGHLMTAACIHYRITGKTNLLDIAKKATDFLYGYYKKHPKELAQNAICPSHYMGVVEMYRTTKDERYKELAIGLVEIRNLVKDGADHNQDRVPFKKQTKAVGHAVRANYLYAGVADVYSEFGDDSLFASLDAIWHDLVERKMYITGACGALYDGVSPNGTTYDPSTIQQVHQAYGQDYQLPNLSAHNESCANIGNMLWNWRMLLSTGEAKYADVMEQVMYNSLLAGVSLDGKRYFYTNPLAVSHNLTHELRWSKDREEYISYCNCCPPNTIRTIAEMHNYIYSLSDKGLYVNHYGGSTLSTTLEDGSLLKLVQETNYPWGGAIKLTVEKAPKKDLSVFLRIPNWSENNTLLINGKPTNVNLKPGKYAEVRRKWKKGDVIELQLPMSAQLMQSNPLVEENKNQVAVRRGPVVYCIESIDIPEGHEISDITIPIDIKLETKKEKIGQSTIVSLNGDALISTKKDWSNKLYQEIDVEQQQKSQVRLVPYYSWDNRGKGDMTVWMPFSR